MFKHGTLGDAKDTADRFSKRDRAAWIVYTDPYSSLYPYISCEGSQASMYSDSKIVYKVTPPVPNTLTVTFTEDEAKEFAEYLETERPALRYFDGFKGGIFQTPQEKSIFRKLGRK